MPETAQEYIARIGSYMKGQDPLTILTETPRRLRSLLPNVSASQLRTRPAPEKWSIIEQVAHLADVEIALGYRVRTVLGSPDGVPIPAFDQDAWQQSMRYAERELPPTLEAFTAARENNLRLYRSLDQAAWEKYGIHAERGRESTRQIVSLNAGHDINHLRQIEAILNKSVSAIA